MKVEKRDMYIETPDSAFYVYEDGEIVEKDLETGELNPATKSEWSYAHCMMNNWIDEAERILEEEDEKHFDFIFVLNLKIR